MGMFIVKKYVFIVHRGLRQEMNFIRLLPIAANRRATNSDT